MRDLPVLGLLTILPCRPPLNSFFALTLLLFDSISSFLMENFLLCIEVEEMAESCEVFEGRSIEGVRVRLRDLSVLDLWVTILPCRPPLNSFFALALLVI